MKPKDLLYSHRYAEAIEAYTVEIREHPAINLHAGIGQAFLGLRRFDEALDHFKRDDEIESARVNGCFPSLIMVGTALWLMGKRREALVEWHRAVAGIQDGSIIYGDSAGGGTQGLLLWHAALSLKDDLEADFAVSYLRTIAQRKGSALSWPRPVIQMVLLENSFRDVLQTGGGSPLLAECVQKASVDLLSRRRLCQTLFYSAFQDRQAGNEAEFREKIRRCSQLENPIIESEWYLARGEVERRSHQGDIGITRPRPVP